MTSPQSQLDPKPAAPASTQTIGSDAPLTAPAPPAAPGAAPGADGASTAPAGRFRRRLIQIGGAAVFTLALYAGVPRVIRALNTVSTDDAYVNGHVTFVAPRVAGQVARVLVDDNYRVRKGDLLVQLDREPFEVQQRLARAAVDSAQADLTAAGAQARGVAAEARSLRFALEHAIEDVHNQVALLGSKVAMLQSQKAILENAQTQYDRVLGLFKSDIAAKQEMDDRIADLHVAQAKVHEATQDIYQVRVNLGLPPRPAQGDDLAQVPDDLDQTTSIVRQAQASMIQAVSRLGVSASLNTTPRQMILEFYRRDPTGDIDRIFDKLVRAAPAVRQAEARLEQARRTLDQANLNLRYCDVVSEIDGVVTRREVNPGNNVIVGQSLMAVRSLTEIWIDANFKETQLARLRIGQAVEVEADMYGSHRSFAGRISGFTMGTGSTLSLLPAENASGNFVKVVQRLPVRVELVDYDPDRTPLFIGLSVTPRVLLKQPPSGPHAGAVLQPYAAAGSDAPAATQAAARGMDARP